MMTIGYVESLLIGSAVPFTRAGTVSGINKKSVSHALFINDMGVTGDEQGDLKYHGGREKAVHFYAIEHYAYWRAVLGDLSLLQQAGAFGENIRSHGISESTICLGDKIRIGDVLMEVSQTRQPCWKLNDRFNVPDMAYQMQESLHTGWYCRVLEAGYCQKKDAITLVERPFPNWTLERIIRVLYHTPLDKIVLNEMLNLPLVTSWQKLIMDRLEFGVVEDWCARMNGYVSQRMSL